VYTCLTLKKEETNKEKKTKVREAWLQNPAAVEDTALDDPTSKLQ
jgi:hypothetical protein